MRSDDSLTNVIYSLCKIHGYISDAVSFVSRYDGDFEALLSDTMAKYALDMCYLQCGEHAGRIRDFNASVMENENLKLTDIKGIRNRIAHNYGTVDYSIMKKATVEELPLIKDYIEMLIPADLLKDEYILYEMTFQEYMKEYHLKDFDCIELRKFLTNCNFDTGWLGI